MEKISYKVSNFEGPLDLLLHLISKNKLDIYNIKISLILEQYLEHIEALQELNMEVSSEFLEMAARLVYIKTVSLLPKHEEAMDLKEELVGDLIEYQECKRIAMMFAQKLNFDVFVRSQQELEQSFTYENKHEISEIVRAYITTTLNKKTAKPLTKESFSEIVSKKFVSVTSKVIFVLRKLWNNEEVLYREIFKGNETKSELIAVFLAILELTKNKRISFCGKGSSLKLKLIRKEER